VLLPALVLEPHLPWLAALARHALGDPLLQVALGWASPSWPSPPSAWPLVAVLSLRCLAAARAWLYWPPLRCLAVARAWP
jgi:hypothetical protein